MFHYTILLLTIVKPILLEGKSPIRVIDIFTNYPNTEEVLKEYSVIQKQRLDSENSAALNITSRSYGDYDYYDKYRPQDYRRPYYSDRRNYHDPGDILESEFGVFDDHRYNNYADRYQDKYVYLQGQKYSDYNPDYYNHYTISKPQNPDDNPENFKDKLNKFIEEVEQRPGFYTKKNNTQIYTIVKPTYYADQFHFEPEIITKAPEVPESSIEVVGDIQSEYGDIITTTTTTTTEAPKKKPAKIIKKRPKPVDLTLNEPNVNTTRMKITNILRKYLVKMHQTKGERKLTYNKDRAYPPVVQTVSGNVVSNLIANTTFGLDEAKQKFLTYPLETIKNKTVNFANKFLSLFTVIQFSNFKCQATSASSAYEGTCYLTNECTSLGGAAMGNCAAGYGVCCVFRGTCGGVGTQNCTYFESPGYPNYFPSDPGVVTPMPEVTTPPSGLPTPDPRYQYVLRQGRHVREAIMEGRREGRQATPPATDQMNALSCIYRVYKSNPNIKQMRIDFIDMELRGPTDGNCVNERLVITGMGLATMVPVLCGYNTGQHLYVDVSMMTGPLQLAVLANAIERKRYKIRICQYSDGCSGNMNCLQYYTGVTGTITSFNYDQAATFNRSTPSYLNNLNYAVCIRREPGYCTVTYTTVGPMNVQYPFQIRNTDVAGMLTVPANQAGVGVINCPDDYIVINGIRLCGDRLNDGSMIADFTRNAPVTDMSGGPIIIPVRTSARTVGRGFKLFYTQNRCPMNTMTGMMVLPVPDPRGRQDDYYEELEET